MYEVILNNCQSLNSSAQQLLRFLIPIFAIQPSHEISRTLPFLLAEGAKIGGNTFPVEA